MLHHSVTKYSVFFVSKNYVNVSNIVLSQYEKLEANSVIVSGKCLSYKLVFNGILSSNLQNGLKQICGSWNENKTLKQGKLFVRYCTINSDSLHDS